MKIYLKFFSYMEELFIYIVIALCTVALFYTVIENIWYRCVLLIVLGLFAIIGIIYSIFHHYTHAVYDSGSPRDYMWNFKDSLHELHYANTVELTQLAIRDCYLKSMLQGGHHKDVKKLRTLYRQFKLYTMYYHSNQNKHKSNQKVLAKLHKVANQTNNYIQKRIKELKPKAKHCNQKKYTKIKEEHK